MFDSATQPTKGLTSMQPQATSHSLQSHRPLPMQGLQAHRLWGTPRSRIKAGQVLDVSHHSFDCQSAPYTAASKVPQPCQSRRGCNALTATLTATATVVRKHAAEERTYITKDMPCSKRDLHCPLGHSQHHNSNRRRAISVAGVSQT